jgi:hypothetical protein
LGTVSPLLLVSVRFGLTERQGRLNFDFVVLLTDRSSFGMLAFRSGAADNNTTADDGLAPLGGGGAGRFNEGLPCLLLLPAAGFSSL